MVALSDRKIEIVKTLVQSAPDKIVGVDLIMPEAVDLKFIPAPLTKEQLAELIQIPPRN